MALNDEHRELLQANIKRISANFIDNITENMGATSDSQRASRMFMRNQQSFGKKDRSDRPPGGASLDDSGFRSELMMRGGADGIMMLLNDDNNMGEEFSDESLFGEDNIEKLIEKKNNSFVRGGSNALGDNSFRSRGGKMRNQMDDSQ